MPSRSPTIKPIAKWSHFGIPEQPTQNVRPDEDTSTWSNAPSRRKEKHPKPTSSRFAPGEQSPDIRNQSLFSDELDYYDDSVSYSESTATGGWWQFDRSRRGSISSEISQNSEGYVENRSPRRVNTSRQDEQVLQDEIWNRRGGADDHHDHRHHELGRGLYPDGRNNGGSISSQSDKTGRRGGLSHVKERSYAGYYSAPSSSGRSTYIEQMDELDYRRSDYSGESRSTIAAPGYDRKGWAAADVGPFYYGLSGLMPAWSHTNGNNDGRREQRPEAPDTTFSTDEGYYSDSISGKRPTALYLEFGSAPPPPLEVYEARTVSGRVWGPLSTHAGSPNYDETRADTLSTLSSDNWEEETCWSDYGSNDGFSSDTATDSSFDSDIESDWY